MDCVGAYQIHLHPSGYTSVLDDQFQLSSLADKAARPHWLLYLQLVELSVVFCLPNELLITTM